MNLSKNDFRKKFATGAAILLVASSVITMGFSKALSNDVNLIVNGETKKVVTYSKNVEDFLETEGIEVKNTEEVVPGINAEIEPGMDIVISSPKSYYIKDGKKIQVTEALGETVAETLGNLNIDLNKHDVVTPALNSETTPGMNITIERVKKEVQTKEEEIPFEIKKIEDKNMYKGETQVVEKGEKGLKLSTIQNTFVNDEHVSVDVLKSEIKQEAKTEVQKVGTKETQAQAALGERKVKRVITMQATAYDPTAGSRTAMGTRARVGAVAVDPRVIPLGSKLYIESADGFPSYGYATAEDTGGAIKGNRIDLFYSTNSQALRFGRRNVKVYVLE
ncbi:3D domain-containing protein [Peptoniphilus stercorisuis]|uniref:Uncharacterized protein YabE (DUF348 family) n=1 Tax=Peptoniphilus stercorisuis TaxID=1436965 RepID=A0ABS4KCY8_9FIRM|nr:3D domain-containing protein [Peptoniphilus stercorisuis]MBP2025622.1 uncharacterized protein YabE (DUF348 family) [Peptoniphilus stercorisuis]